MDTLHGAVKSNEDRKATDDQLMMITMIVMIMMIDHEDHDDYDDHDDHDDHEDHDDYENIWHYNDGNCDYAKEENVFGIMTDKKIIMRMFCITKNDNGDYDDNHDD